MDLTPQAERSPKAGYWFRALRFAGEKAPDRSRFAACCYPASPTSGKFSFLISDSGVIFKKPGVLKDLEVHPPDPLREGWTRLD